MDTPPVLELHEASVMKGDNLVLDRLSLTIRAGEHTAILGPNGAGKSMLLRLLTHDERALETDNTPAVKVFGDDRWNIFELRAKLEDVPTLVAEDFDGGRLVAFHRALVVREQPEAR